MVFAVSRNHLENRQVMVKLEDNPGKDNEIRSKVPRLWFHRAHFFLIFLFPFLITLTCGVNMIVNVFFFFKDQVILPAITNDGVLTKTFFTLKKGISFNLESNLKAEEKSSFIWNP